MNPVPHVTTVINDDDDTVVSVTRSFMNMNTDGRPASVPNTPFRHLMATISPTLPPFTPDRGSASAFNHHHHPRTVNRAHVLPHSDNSIGAAHLEPTEVTPEAPDQHPDTPRNTTTNTTNQSITEHAFALDEIIDPPLPPPRDRSATPDFAQFTPSHPDHPNYVTRILQRIRDGIEPVWLSPSECMAYDPKWEANADYATKCEQEQARMKLLETSSDDPDAVSLMTPTTRDTRALLSLHKDDHQLSSFTSKTTAAITNRDTPRTRPRNKHLPPPYTATSPNIIDTNGIPYDPPSIPPHQNASIPTTMGSDNLAANARTTSFATPSFQPNLPPPHLRFNDQQDLPSNAPNPMPTFNAHNPYSNSPSHFYQHHPSVTPFPPPTPAPLYNQFPPTHHHHQRTTPGMMPNFGTPYQYPYQQPSGTQTHVQFPSRPAMMEIHAPASTNTTDRSSLNNSYRTPESHSFHSRSHTVKINRRGTISRKEAFWDCQATSFDAYFGTMKGLLAQQDASYLYNDEFIYSFINIPSYQTTPECFERWGQMTKQIAYDITWFWGVIITTIKDIQLPEILLYEPQQQSIFAFHAMKLAYSHSGQSPSDRFNSLSIIFRQPYTYSPARTLPVYARKFEQITIQLYSIKPNFASDADVLDQFRRNTARSGISLDHLIITQIERQTRWLLALKHIVKYAPIASLSTHTPISHALVTSSSPTPPINRDVTTAEDFYTAFMTETRACMRMQMQQSDALVYTYNTMKFNPSKLNLSIPADLWRRLEEPLKKQITRIRQELRDEEKRKDQSRSSSKPETTTDTAAPSPAIGKQYPSINHTTTKSQTELDFATALSLVNRTAIQSLSDDNSIETDGSEDDVIFSVRLSLLQAITSLPEQSLYHPDDDLIIHIGDIRNMNRVELTKLFYAIVDGGADSTVLGHLAHIIAMTGRFARLVGYDPVNTLSGRIPIVSAYLKSRLSTGETVLLQVNEAPYLANSDTTLISEFQVREYGKILDSCSRTHIASSEPLLYGKQRFEVTTDDHIPLENLGAIMAFEILPYNDGDDRKYPIIEINSKEIWVPKRYRSVCDNDMDTTSTSPIALAQHTASQALPTTEYDTPTPSNTILPQHLDQPPVQPILSTTPLKTASNTNTITPLQPQNEIHDPTLEQPSFECFIADNTPTTPEPILLTTHRIPDDYSTALLLDKHYQNSKWLTAWNKCVSSCTPIDPIPGPSLLQIHFSITEDGDHIVQWLAGTYNAEETFERAILDHELDTTDIPITVSSDPLIAIPRDNYFEPPYSIATHIQFITDLLKASVVTYRQYYRHFLTAYEIDINHKDLLWYNTWINTLSSTTPTPILPQEDITRLTDLFTSFHEQQQMGTDIDHNRHSQHPPSTDTDAGNECYDDTSYTTPIATLEHDHYQRCVLAFDATTVEPLSDLVDPSIQCQHHMMNRQELLCTIPDNFRHAKYIDVVTGTTFWENALDSAQQKFRSTIETYTTDKSLLFYITYDGRRKIRFQTNIPVQISNNDTKRLKTSYYTETTRPNTHNINPNQHRTDIRLVEKPNRPLELPLTLDTIPHHISHAFKIDVATGTTHWQDAAELQFRYLRERGFNPHYLTPGTYFDFRIKQNGKRTMRTCTKNYTTCTDTNNYKNLPHTHASMVTIYLSTIPSDIDHAVELDIKTRTTHWRDARAEEYRRLRHYNISPMDLHFTTTFAYYIYSNGTREIRTHLHPSNRQTIGDSTLLVTDSPALPQSPPHTMEYFFEYQDMDMPIDEALEQITTATINAPNFLTFSNTVGYQNIPATLCTSTPSLLDDEKYNVTYGPRSRSHQTINAPPSHAITDGNNDPAVIRQLALINQVFRNGRV